jgi:hypothetical protein
MTFACLIVMTGTGVPAWIFALAMICDTVIVVSLVQAGVIHV